MDAGLIVETFGDAGAFDRLAPEWDALAALGSPRAPFRTSSWNRLWWAHFRRDGWAARDELRLHALRSADGALVALAPMMLTRRPGRLPLAARELQFLGADSNVTEMRGMVCRPGWEARAVAALERALSARADWDWIQWRGLPAGCAPPGPGFRPAPPLFDFYLDLQPTWEELRAGLPRNMKEALRKCYNSLARDGHRAELRATGRPDEVRDGLRRLLALHALRAGAAQGVPHIDVFASPRSKAFILDYAAEAARDGRARLFTLDVAGAPVAMRLGFACDDELYLYYSGYDPDWARYSVMTTLLAEALKWAIAGRFRRVNLSTGLDLSKTRWRPSRVEFVEGFQPAPHRRARAALAVMDAVRRRPRERPPLPPLPPAP